MNIRLNVYMGFVRLILLLVLQYHVCISLDVDFKISSIHNLIEDKDVKCTEIINYFLERAYKYNPMLNAIINFNPNAITEAELLDDYYSKNNKFLGKLHCIPVLIKDNIAVQGIPTTGGIKALRYSIPNKDAYVAERLKAEGAIVIGKSNMAELAFSAYNSETGGACRNPWDLTRSCSRSSSGSGCGIAAGLSVISIGTDTDGSIMGPASYNGIFGLRPPHGLTNFDGVMMLLESDDTIGPFAQHLDDLVLAYSIMIKNSSFYETYSNSSLIKGKDVKIGYIKNFLQNFTLNIDDAGTFINKIDDEVRDTFFKTLDIFKNMSVEVVELEIPVEDFENILIEIRDAYNTRYYQCALKCSKAYLNAYFNNTERFQTDSTYHSFDDLKNTPLLSNFFQDFFKRVDVDFPEKTCSDSCKVYNDYKKVFAKRLESWFRLSGSPVDAILVPTSTTLPQRIDSVENDFVLGSTFITAFSGYASLNIPVQFSKIEATAPDGLPIGMMLVASNQGFPKMLRIARLYEYTHLKVKKLPKSTPILQTRCISNTSSFKLIPLVSISISFIFNYLINFK